MGVRKEFEWEWEAPLSLWGDPSFVEVSGSHRDRTARPEPDPKPLHPVTYKWPRCAHHPHGQALLPDVRLA